MHIKQSDIRIKKAPAVINDRGIIDLILITTYQHMRPF